MSPDTMRDLLWYCYLDQDEFDSSFFYLEDSAPFYKRNKSRDVLRYVIGFDLPPGSSLAVM